MDYQDPFAPDAPQGDTSKQVSGLQRYLNGDKSAFDPRQGMPAGYTIENNQVVPTSQWDQWGKGALEFFGPVLAESLVPGLNTVSGATSGVETGTKMGTLNSILQAVDTGSKVYGGLSDVFGGAAKSSQSQNNTSDALKLALYNAVNNSQNNAKKFALTAPSARRATAFSSIIPQYASPTQVHWNGPGSGLRGEVPTYTGGAKSIIDAAHDPRYSALNDRIVQDEMMQQMQGGPSGGDQDAASGAAPTVGDTSGFDNFLGGASLTTGLLGALSKSGILKRANAPVDNIEV